MRILVNRNIKKLILEIVVIGICLLLANLWIIHSGFGTGMGLSAMGPLAMGFSTMGLSALSIILAVIFILWALFAYFKKQDQILEEGVSAIDRFLAGDMEARLEGDQEGELSLFYHKVNTLAQVLAARADKETSEKAFLKDTISDISHQLKTPLAALNIYNGLLQEDAETDSQTEEFLALSEKELDRIETLVQNLLKITKLDAGTLTLSKGQENLAEMMRDVELHFAYRAKSEGKEIKLVGEEQAALLCDRNWLLEAIENLVKNALDHTEVGDRITISWQQFSSMVKVQVSDTGSGIHPEDMHHIFKRFYRSRFSQDQQGVGLGLSLTKAIVEEHRGTIEVESQLGKGTTFTMNFLTRM